MPKYHKYSVLLAYAQQISDDDTYYAFVRAEDKGRAIQKAREEAVTANGNDFELEDFGVILVTKGWNHAV